MLFSIRDALVTTIAVLAGLCSWVNPAGAGLFSSTGPVIAILADNVFLGEAKGNLDGSGSVWIQARDRPGLSCRGEFISSAELGGVGNLRCSDGAAVTFQFQRLGITRGHGAGSSDRGPLSFTYGMSPAESRPYLKAPPGKELRLGKNEILLVDAGKDSPADAAARRP